MSEIAVLPYFIIDLQIKVLKKSINFQEFMFCSYIGLLKPDITKIVTVNRNTILSLIEAPGA